MNEERFISVENMDSYTKKCDKKIRDYVENQISNASYVDKNQGTENSGKVLGTNANGEVIPLNGYGFEYDKETKMLKYGTDPTSNLNQGIGLDDTLSKRGYAADAGAVGELKEDLSKLQQGGYIADQQQIGEKVNAWLDEHPEATTTVQDNSLTSDKFTDVLKLHTLKDYVTPQMFGAVGDGVHDDTDAVNNAISSAKQVIFPNGVYKCTNDITVTDGKSIKSLSNSTGGNAKLKFENGHGLILNGRCISVSNITLEGDTTGIGLKLTGTNQSHFVNISGLIINYFKIAVLSDVTMWDNTFVNVRVNECETGIKVEHKNIGSFCITYTNVYFNNVGCDLIAYALDATFISCNFGVINFPTVIMGTNAKLTFIGCNFECDTNTIDSKNAMFELTSLCVKFTNCKFQNYAGVNNKVFMLYDYITNITFENCQYIRKKIDDVECPMPNTNFFDGGHVRTTLYGGIKYMGGCNTLPRPVFTNNMDRPCVNDFEKCCALYFYGTSVDKQKLTAGTLMYSLTDKVMCFYNGTNIIKLSDNSIIV